VPLVTVLGAKGGCGASLIATNLALALTRYGGTLLVDLHIGDGGDDLLLDLSPERSWADLLPVAGELTERHLELAIRTHSSGLSLLAGPAGAPDAESEQRLIALLQALAGQFEWTVLDSPSSSPMLSSWLTLSDVIALVATADPPALRAAQRRLASLPSGDRARVRLVLNQFTRAHPAHPSSVAASLECPLLAVFPTDPRAVGFQINFGRPCVLDPQSGFGRSAAAMAKTMAAKRSARRAAA
jgi:pilus assembly protein CpaE